MLLGDVYEGECDLTAFRCGDAWITLKRHFGNDTLEHANFKRRMI